MGTNDALLMLGASLWQESLPPLPAFLHSIKRRWHVASWQVGMLLGMPDAWDIPVSPVVDHLVALASSAAGVILQSPGHLSSHLLPGQPSTPSLDELEMVGLAEAMGNILNMIICTPWPNDTSLCLSGGP